MEKLRFPKDFIFGTATAAYQIEGAYKEDEKGESIWDRFSHIPGNVAKMHNGDIACDHYHRYKEDVQLLKSLGIKSYRFSIAWPRIFPKGFGEINQKGIQFYRDLIDELIKNDIEPAITIYHWDLPQKLQDIGGWANPQVADYYVDYANLLFREFGDRVKTWITHNEPWVASYLGYALGVHAPGIKDMKMALLAAHNILLSHFKAVKAYRELEQDGQIGITLNLSTCYSNSADEEDIAAAHRSDGWNNRWFLDAALKGTYPEDMIKIFSDTNIMPELPKELFTEVFETSDFLGINYYTRQVVKNNSEAFIGAESVAMDNPKTEMGWEIYPQGLYDLLTRIHRDYGNIDLYITENGAAFNDMVNRDGKVEDENRLDYLYTHFAAALSAIEAGVPLKGYYIWSFMDNFEWAEGYEKRFGIVHVNYKTQERTIKKSAYWYKELIERSNK
ncbi:GH1 family beta-glucosidase [Clostridium cellulovorans]|uniref:Beta-glucosidase n=2 Tax=Clostridium cellulovorans TaxID=1493 RepID=D9SVH0_CLOC7|nr:GH1 family beta-glucosidase [Clostridium cellulovorans]AAQ00997.1 beta-glucosidase A [Clostridium cellulovorans]ADL51094.1 beta-galactosidase [Clostridium cellulovorans 743B]